MTFEKDYKSMFQIPARKLMTFGRQAEEIAQLLLKYGFAGSKLYYRERKQRYKERNQRVSRN